MCQGYVDDLKKLDNYIIVNEYFELSNHKLNSQQDNCWINCLLND